MIVRITCDIEVVFADDEDEAVEFARQSLEDGAIGPDEFRYEIVDENIRGRLT